MADSLIRLRQLNSGELATFIKSFIASNTVVSGTGILTEEFYPLRSNPSGYLTNISGFLTSGSTGNFVDYGYLAASNTTVLNTVSALYYLKNNPSGFLTGFNSGIYITTGQTGQFASPANVVYTTGDQTIAGTKTFSSTIIVSKVSGLAGDGLINLNNNSLRTPENLGTLNWVSRTVSDTGSKVSIDWQNRRLSGNWEFQSLKISGNPVLTGAISGLYYSNSNPSGYINSGLVVQSSGYLQNQIENLRLTGAFLTTGAGDNRYARVGNSITSNNNFVIYDGPAGYSTFKYSEDDEYYLKNIASDLAYVDLNGISLSPFGLPTIYGFTITGGAINVPSLALNGKGVLTTVDSGNLLNRASGDALYYSITNPDNYATKSYVSTFAPLTYVASISDVYHNTKFFLYNSLTDSHVLQYQEGGFFILSDSGDITVLDILGTTNSGNPYLRVSTAQILTGNITELNATNINLNGIPIKQAISGAGSTGSLVSQIDDNHNRRLTIYDTGSLTNRFYAGSGRNDNFYLQYYYVYPNTSIELKSSIDLANQSIDGFNINANNITAELITLGGLSVLTTADTGNFINKNSYILKDQNNKTSLGWSSGNRILYDNSQAKSVDWGFRGLYDNLSNEISLGWNSRQLYKMGESPSFDWQNLILSGNWEAGALKISGQSVVTGGPYYPLNSNPASYAKLGSSIITNNNFVLYDSAAENTGLFFKDGAGGFYIQDPSNFNTKIDWVNKTINNFSGNFTTLKVNGNSVSTGASSGSSSLVFLNKTGNYTLASSNDVILANSTTASVLLSLPAASGVSGKLFRIKRTNSGAFNVIVSGNYIDGETGINLVNRYASLSIISDGSGYYTF